jgi:hypothetical protein
MAKDPTKNRYFQLGIAWNSWTLKRLEEDAHLHQMEDQITKLMVLRLTEYYQLVAKGVIVPGATAMMPAPVQAQTEAASSNGHTPNVATATSRRDRVATSAVSEEEPEGNTIAESSEADQNADDALDFFKMDDDDEP